MAGYDCDAWKRAIKRVSKFRVRKENANRKGTCNMRKQWIGGIAATLVGLGACAMMVVSHSYKIHARNFGSDLVDGIVVSSEVFGFEMGGIAPIRGMRDVVPNPLPWPRDVTVEWRSAATGQKYKKTVAVPPPPPDSSKSWFIAVLFFDDEIMLKSLAQVMRWDPVLKGAPFYYGEDVEERRQQVKK